MHRLRRVLALFLTTIMLIGMLPTVVLSAGHGDIIFSSVKVEVKNGVVTLKATPTQGLTGQIAEDQMVFGVIWNAADPQPAFANSLDGCSIEDQKHGFLSFIKSDATTDDIEYTLNLYSKGSSNDTGTLMYGDDVRKFFLDGFGLKSLWQDGMDDAATVKLVEDTISIDLGGLYAPSHTWNVGVWTVKGGSNNYAEATFTLDDNGNIVEPAKSCTVIFNTNGGSDIVSSAEYSTDSAGVPDPEYKGTKAGHIFKYWTTEVDSAGAKVTFPYEPTGFKDGDEITLYAYWIPVVDASDCSIEYDGSPVTADEIIANDGIKVDGTVVTDKTNLTITSDGSTTLPEDVGTYELVVTYDDNDTKVGSDAMQLTITPKRMDKPTIGDATNIKHNSFDITITSDAKYVVLKSTAEAPTAGDPEWDTSDGTVSITDRDPNTKYVIYAYTPAKNGNYIDSGVVKSAEITTSKAPYTANMFKDITVTYDGTEWTKEELDDLIVKSDGVGTITVTGVVSKTNGDIKTASDAGTYTVTFKVAGNNNYAATENLTVDLTVNKKKVKLESERNSYGTKVNAAIDLKDAKFYITGVNGKLKEGTDFTLAYAVTDSEGLGLTPLNGSVTGTPTKKGNASAAVTATLLNSNYEFETDKDELTLPIAVTDGLFTFEFNRNPADLEDVMNNQDNNAIGAPLKLPKNTFTRQGYAFKGWALKDSDTVPLYTDEQDNVTFTTDNKGAALTDGGKVILYAVWEKTYTLTVNAGDGGKDAVGSGEYEEGATVEISVSSAATGFEFKEWKVKGTLNGFDATLAKQNITMPAENVELTASFVSKLTITPKNKVEKTTSTIGSTKISDFIASASPMFTGDTVANLFTAAPVYNNELSAFTGNGVVISFYTDAERTKAMNTLPSAAGTYYYTVVVTEEMDNTPKENYLLQPIAATEGILTITQPTTPSPGPGGGGGGVVNYTLTFNTNGGTAVESIKKPAGTKIELTQTTTRAGYEFAGWYEDEELTIPVTEVTLKGNMTVYAGWNKVFTAEETGVAGWLNTEEHMAYMQGYPEGTFMPDGNLTRAEAAQLFYNLLLDKEASADMNFDDVAADAWYAPAVSKLASMGIIMGTGDGLFEPERQITRAEFTAIGMRFTTADTSGENTFSDVKADDWFHDVVVGSVKFGWIRGYEDNTFRPNNAITRAETASIVNRMLGRSADAEYVEAHKDELKQFTDLSPEHWGYLNIVEATNAHDYVKDNNKETWK